MLPDPLHPALVHLPLALAVLLPAGALFAFLVIARGALPARFWATIVVLHALLAGSAYLAVETGENEEERVEQVVSEPAIEAHEEAAERFLWLAVGAAVISAAGLLPGTRGKAGRALTLAAGAIVFAAALSVGHSGGALVYEHGAAQAYTGGATAAASDARGEGAD